MESNPYHECYQWKNLKVNTERNIEPPQTGCLKALVSQDHLILVFQNQVYTLNLKVLYWSQFNITKTGNPKQLTCNLCLARPGLIVEINSSGTLELLTFETEKVPQNFIQKSLSLANAGLPRFTFSGMNADLNFIYVCDSMRDASNNRNETVVYQLNIEECKAVKMDIQGSQPCGRNQEKSVFSNEKLFVFGGKSIETSQQLSDLWVLHLGEMRWEKLPDINPDGLIAQLQDSPSIFAMNDQILISKMVNKTQIIQSYGLNEGVWYDPHLISGSPLPSDLNLVTKYHDTIIFCSGVYAHLLRIPLKQKKTEAVKQEVLMKELFETKKYADITFTIENHEFQVHKCLITQRCPYFAKMFESGMNESHSNPIPIEDKEVKANIFEVILRYIYLCKVELNDEIAEDLLKHAHKFGLKDLTNDCQQFLITEIKVENAVPYLHLAEQYEIEQLRKACVIFIAKNFCEVLNRNEPKEFDSKTLIEIYDRKPCPFH